MDHLVRFSLFLTLIAGLAVGVAYAQPVWIADLGLDFWKLPELEQKLARATEQQGELEAHQHQFLEKSAQKKRILEQLIDQKLSLYEAAAQIQDLTDPVHLEVALPLVESVNNSPEENFFRLVIYWAERELEPDSPQAATVRSRLEAELRQQYPIAAAVPAH